MRSLYIETEGARQQERRYWNANLQFTSHSQSERARRTDIAWMKPVAIVDNQLLIVNISFVR